LEMDGEAMRVANDHAGPGRDFLDSLTTHVGNRSKVLYGKKP